MRHNPGKWTFSSRAIAFAAAYLRITLPNYADVTDVELSVGAGGAAEWRTLSQLSTGQKATAVLLLLLASEEAPLVIDQPEDDLDNFFISDSVVPEIRAAKRRRQFVFATHNANLPVLGDAELIVGLTAKGDASGGLGKDTPDDHGLDRQ